MTTFPLPARGEARRDVALPPLRVPPAVTLLVTCMAIGLLVAAAVFPIVGAAGLVARAGTHSFVAMPADLAEPRLPQASRILARDGSTLAVVYFNENRVVVPLARIPKVMQDAIISIEDARYYEHGGVDLRGLLRAVVRNSRAGEVQQGGSTITQQYVKNVLVESASDSAGRKAATERSPARKVREIRYAIELERRYTKPQILERYLNIAYFGSGVYGVGTAAQHYFGKPVDRLAPGEAAQLAGLVKNPTAFDPIRHPVQARERRDLVLGRMVALGHLDRRTAEAARRAPLGLRISRSPGIEDNPLAPYFLDHIRSQILDDPDGTMARLFGATPAQRRQTLFQGGLTIRTTLAPAVQRHALDTLRSTLPDPRDPAGATVVVQPGTGDILAMAGVNHDPANRKVNLAVGGTSGFQAGSTFKAFVLAAAIEAHIPLGLTLNAPQTYRSPVFRNYVDGRIGPYTIRNAGDSEAGRFNVVTGTWHSVNTFYLQLEERTGFDRPAEIAAALGIRAFPLRRVPSFVLGTNEVSPLDVAGAYAAFAAHGEWCRPRAITSVIRADGRAFEVPSQCEQALARPVADTVTAVLQGVISQGTGRAAAIGRPAAGKTGTTNGPTAAWFDGYTPDLASVVWVGYPSDPAHHPLHNIEGVRTVYGGTLPARIWREVMTFAHASIPARGFTLVGVAAPPAVVRRPPPVVPPIVIPAAPPPDFGQPWCRKHCHRH